MSVKRWKLGWKRCDCVKCEAAITIEQTEENCGWVKWGDHKEEVARLKSENARLKGEEYAHSELGSLVPRHLLEYWMEKAKDLEKTKNEFREIGLSIDEENDKLKAEIARLRKAEEMMDRERMNDEYDLNNQNRIINGLLRDKEQLKAEVERVEPELEQRCRELNLSLGQQAVQLRQIGELKAEVERLRKAGDAMAKWISVLQITHDHNPSIDYIGNWNAAKEGKPSV